MRFFTFQDFNIVFKKRYKMFVFIFLLLTTFFILANKTFFKDKINQKYIVIFDYQFYYSWLTTSKQSLEYDRAMNPLMCRVNLDKDSCLKIPFKNIKEFHAMFFELIHTKNIVDLKSKESEDPIYKIAKAFHFDTPNFTYPNRRISIMWHDLDEAEEYLDSLHDKAINDLTSLLVSIYNSRYDDTIIELNEKLVSFPPEIVGEIIKKKHGFNSDEKLNEFVDKFISQSKLSYKLSDNDLFKLILSKELIPQQMMFSLDFLLSKKNEVQFLNVFSNSREIIYYYLGKNYDTKKKIESANIVFLPDSKKFIENMNLYIPKHKPIFQTVSTYYIYFIEIFFVLLVSFLIIFTLHIKDKED
jgi:hypothetical protein